MYEFKLFASLFFKIFVQKFFFKYITVNGNSAGNIASYGIVSLYQVKSRFLKVVNAVNYPVLAVNKFAVFKADNLKASFFVGVDKCKNIFLRHID